MTTLNRRDTCLFEEMKHGVNGRLCFFDWAIRADQVISDQAYSSMTTFWVERNREALEGQLIGVEEDETEYTLSGLPDPPIIQPHRP